MSKWSNEHLAELVASHKASGSLESRNQITDYLHPWLCKQAATMAAKLRKPQAELIGYAFEGLIDALEKYEPGKAAFLTFAAKRVKGAMIEGIRAEDPLSRKCIAFKQQAEPDPDPLDPKHRALKMAKACELVDVAADQPPIWDEVDRADVMTFLAGKVEPLDRLIFWCYFRQRKTMAETAKLIGITDKRVSKRLKTIRTVLEAVVGKEKLKELLTSGE